jgi:penicillin-binding protein 2
LRGRILDRFGNELAGNRRNLRVILIPEQVKSNATSVEEVVKALEKFVPLTDKQRERVFKEVKKNPSFMPITVAENLEWDQFAALNLHSPDLPGLQLDAGDTRDYKYGEKLVHVLGYVAAVNEKELSEDDDPLLKLPGFRIGKVGIEKAVDDQLRGKAGARSIEVNAHGRIIRELDRQSGDPGDDVVLTLDMEVQKFAQARLEGEAASCVVMDAFNGDVLAMVANPGYDPNEFNKGITTQGYKALLEDDHLPLINKPIAGQYPPGSTFKMVVAAAAVEHNVIAPETSVFCSGGMPFGGRVFHCWKKGGHGSVNMLQGIMHSCDVYFYELSRRLGIDKIDDMARRFGFGAALGIEIPGEKSGLMPNSGWKLATTGVKWMPGENLSAGIGQGFITSTPLQLCTYAARIANGGRKVVPHLLRSVGTKSFTHSDAGPIGVSDRAIQIVQKGMDMVSNIPGGTAYGSRIVDPQYALAGKTGTAQVRVITREERVTGVKKNEDLPWALRDHALFVAFAPVAAPRYAISVVVEHGGSGSKAAAPLARDVMLLTLQRDPSRLPAIGPIASSKAPSKEG